MRLPHPTLPQYMGSSYGRLADDSSGYFSESTPNAENGTTTFSGFVEEEVLADVPRGFYDAPFLVGLSSSDPALAIRYTTNGSPPHRVHGNDLQHSDFHQLHNHPPSCCFSPRRNTTKNHHGHLPLP